MSDNGRVKDEFAALDAIDLATMKEDKVCIQVDHETKAIAWKFAAPQSDPYGMLIRCLLWDAIINSDLAKKVAELEARIQQLEQGRR